MTNINPNVTLHNGISMPQLGFGVWKMENGDEVINSVKDALATGYRSIDTAKAYRNEEGVGQALKQSGLKREEIFLTTKLKNQDQGYQSTLDAFEGSLELLDTDYLDLYLIHWPGKDRYIETWKAFEKLYEDGRVRAIGVCNFEIHHLETLKAESTIIPMVNQIELHPLLNQKELRQYCQERNILVEAWSPLAQGDLLHDPILEGIAHNYGKTIAQVILRWDLQHGLITIPKSSTPERIRSNFNIFDFELTSADMQTIDEMNTNVRKGSHPDQLLF